MTPSSFPRRTLSAGRTIYRIHRADRDPWWFSVEGTGRFDPVGTDRGAAYLAERPLGAWVEVFRKGMTIAEADVTERALFAVEVGQPLRLADLTSRRALGFGVTASLGADQDYGPSQAFAVDAVRAGFDGIRYLVRHDPAQRLYGVALFSAAGVSWPAGVDGPLPDDLIAEAVREFGYRVLLSP